MKKMPSFLLALTVLAAASSVTSSCSPSMGVVAGGAATYSYVRGELVVATNASLDKSFAAALQAMKDMQFEVTHQSKDGLEGKIDAKRLDDQVVTIRMRRETDAMTTVRVKVGVLGDRKLSEEVYEMIHKYL